LACTALALLLLAGLGAGCDGKIAQCNRLIDAINKAQAPMKKQAKNDPKVLSKIETNALSLAKKVRAVELKDEKLIALRDSYAKMAEELASTAKDTAKVFAEGDAKKAEEARKNMGKFGPRETKLVAEMNGYCQGKQ